MAHTSPHRLGVIDLGFFVIAVCVIITRSVEAQTTRVSVATDGTPGNGPSIDSQITPDGRFVVFWSRASNLVAGDTNGFDDIFVHDRTTRQTTRVSVSSTGVEGNREAWGAPQISDGGRYVAFQSHASNLTPGLTNGSVNIFVHDRVTQQTTRANVSSSGIGANSFSTDPAISGDGRWVAFSSSANNLIDGEPLLPCCQSVFLHDRTTAQTTRISVGLGGERPNAKSYRPTVSNDGQIIAFMSEASNLVPNDTNGADDVFVHDRTTGQTTRVNVSSAGVQANAGLPGFAARIALSDDARLVVFRSDASNLVAGDTNGRTDVFVHDRVTGQTTRVSVSSAGAQSNGHSGEPAISGDGRVVAFNSDGSNLVPGDTNLVTDGFIHDRVTGVTTRVNVSSSGAQGAGALSLDLTTDGAIVSFASNPRLLVSGASDGWDVFVHNPSGISPLPGPPTSLTANVVGSTVTLAWGAPASGAAPTSYVLEAGTATGASNVLSQDVGRVLSLTASAPNGVYFVRVRGRNANGTGPPSNEVTVRIGIACTVAPGTPATLTSSVVGFTVSLAWSAATGDPTSYLLEAGSTPGAINVARVDIGPTLQFSATAPTGTYYIRVRAANACGTSPPSNEVTVVVGPTCSVPGPPGSLAANVNGSSVTLTWTASTGSPASYVVEAGASPGTSNLAVVDTGSVQLQLNANAPPGTYFVRVRGRSACGIGAPSTEITLVVR